MKTLIIIGFVIATWHFIYEGIIAPSIRLHLRNELFKLRDELRAEKNKDLTAEDEAAFWFVHDGINNFLNRLSGLTIERSRRLYHEYINDQEARTTLDNHMQKVMSVENSAIRSVFDRTNHVIHKAMLTNAGGWFIYIIPLAIVMALAGSIARAAKGMLLTPTAALEKLIPTHK
ncbi:hypothetical protein [Castellaniella ginsengisoli]|uniref:DUF2937 family protein n=1 Tax=Castellaniella ginsengisoli TaxID=546114 RepID=A0AB39CT72_9BURK